MNKRVLGRFIKKVISGLFNLAGVVTVIALVVAGILNFPTQVGIVLYGLFQFAIAVGLALAIGGIWGVFLWCCLLKAQEECGE